MENGYRERDVDGWVDGRKDISVTDTSTIGEYNFFLGYYVRPLSVTRLKVYIYSFPTFQKPMNWGCCFVLGGEGGIK